MATAYNAGSAYVQLVPSLRGFAGKLRTELRSVNETVSVRAEADVSTLRAEIQAAAQAASAGVRADIAVGVDPTGLRAEMQAAVQAAAAGLRADIDVGFDTAQLRTQLQTAVAAAASAVSASVGVDVDEAGLRTRLAAVTGLKVRVELDPDIAGLRALLAALPPINVRVDLQPDLAALRAQLAAANLSADLDVNVDKDGSARGAAGGLSRVLKIATAAVAGLGAAGPQFLAPLISALVASAGAAGLIPAALTAAGASFAAIKIGFSGVGDTFKALATAQEDAGAAGAAAAAQQEAAAKRVADAVRGVAEAQRQADRTAITSAQQVADARDALADAQAAAAERVASAQQALDRAVEQSGQRVAAARERVSAAIASAVRSTAAAEQTLERAQRTARAAQEDLTRARKDATEQLEDLKLSLAGAALDEEAAVLALERARERLANMPAGSTGLDFREAELAVRQASQALDETRERFGDVREASAAAGRAGVEGSDGVRDAQQRVADANQGVADAEAGLVQARTDGAAQIADAQQALARTQIDGARDVADAQANLAQAQTEGAAQVADAQQGVARAQQSAAWAQEDAARQVQQAQEALAEAYASTGSAAETSADKAAAALAKLAPAAREYVAAVQALRPAWDAVRLDVQQALFAGLGASLTTLANAQLPGLRDGLVAVADGFNLGAREVAGFLSSAGAVRDVRGILMETGTATGLWASALAPITAMFVDISAVGAPIMTELAGSFLAASERAAAFIANARATGDLDRWIRGGLEALSQLGEFLGNIGGSFAAIFDGMEAAGTGAMDVLVLVTGELRRFLESATGQEFLITFFRTLSDTVAALMPGLQAVGTALAESFVALAPAMVPLGQAISGVAAALAPLLPVVAEIVSFLGTYLAEAAIAVIPLIRTIAEVVGTVLMAAFEALKPVFVIIVDALRELTPAFQRIAESIGELLVAAIEAIAPMLPPLAEAFIRIVEALLPVVDVIIDFATQLITALAPVLPEIANMIVKLVDALIPLVDPLVRIAEVLLPLFVGALTNSIEGSVGFAGMLTDVLVWTLDNLVVPAFELVASIIQGFADLFAYVGNEVVPAVSAGIGTAFTSIGDVWNAVGQFLTDSFTNFSNFFSAVWTSIRDFFATTWASIRDAAVNLWAVIRDFFVVQFEQYRVGFVNIWTAVRDFFALIWTTIRDTAVNLWVAIRDFFAGAFENYRVGFIAIWSGIRDFFASTWTAIRDTAVNLWSIIRDFFGTAFANFTGFFTDTWNTIVATFDRVWNGIVDIARNVWETVRRAFIDGVNGVIRIINGFAGVINNVAGMLGFTINLGVAELQYATGGPVPAAARKRPNEFATGGPLPGYAPGRDTVPAMLSPGEYVIRPEAARAIGLDRLNQLNRAHIAGYATGGLVTDDDERGLLPPRRALREMEARRIVDGADHDGPGTLRQGFGGVRPHVAQAGHFLRAKFGVRTVGGIGQRAGASDHPRGLALDFMTYGDTAKGDRLSDYAVANAKHLALKYIIWKQRINQGGGWKGMEDRGSVTANHFDHPHLSFLDLPGTGKDFNGSGAGWDPIGDIIRSLLAPLRNSLDAQKRDGALPQKVVAGVFSKVLDHMVGMADAQDGMGVGGGAAGAGPIRDQVVAVANRYGWGSGAQWQALDRLIQKESSWDPNAQNPTSTAFGLFQFLNSTWGTVGAKKTSNPGLQAEAGLRYIQQRYRNPVGALDFHNRNNWYDGGGVARGRGIMLKNVLAPERVLSPRQNVAFEQLVAAATSSGGGPRASAVLSPEQWQQRSGQGGVGGPLIGSLSVSAGDNASAKDIIDEAMWQARTARTSGRYSR